MLDTLAAITWDLDPILIDFGPVQIRYYGVMFALTIYTAFWLFRHESLRNGKSPEYAEKFLWYAVAGIIGGARLGHCLFYEPERYLSNPIEILYFWKGGLASHGATAGIFFVLWLFARHNKVTFRFVADCAMLSVAIAAGGVRIGNFFNSEIVGRPFDGPWAVIFTRYDAIPRHPTAIYEVIMGLITAAVLIWLIRKDFRRTGSGLLSGVTLIMYFTFRFLVEFFKEYQVKDLINSAAEVELSGQGIVLTRGQHLSIVPVCIGVLMLVLALRQPKDAVPEPVSWWESEQARLDAAQGAPASKKKRKKRKG